MGLSGPLISSGNVELDHASSNVAFPARAPVCCFQVMLQQEARPETVSDQKSGGAVAMRQWNGMDVQVPWRMDYGGAVATASNVLLASYEDSIAYAD